MRRQQRHGKNVINGPYCRTYYTDGQRATQLQSAHLRPDTQTCKTLPRWAWSGNSHNSRRMCNYTHRHAGNIHKYTPADMHTDLETCNESTDVHTDLQRLKQICRFAWHLKKGHVYVCSSLTFTCWRMVFRVLYSWSGSFSSFLKYNKEQETVGDFPHVLMECNHILIIANWKQIQCQTLSLPLSLCHCWF